MKKYLLLTLTALMLVAGFSGSDWLRKDSLRFPITITEL